MSFHSQLPPDSSNEEDVDMSAWTKKGSKVASTKPNQRSAPPASMIAETQQPTASDDEEIALEKPLATNKRKHSTPPTAGPSIQAVNRPSKPDRESSESVAELMSKICPDRPAPITIDGDDEENGEEEQKEVARVLTARHVHVLIPPFDEDRSQYRDLSGGRNVVNRVVKECSEDEAGALVYKIQFEDMDTREVSFDELLEYSNGTEALSEFTANHPSPTPSPSPPLVVLLAPLQSRKIARHSAQQPKARQSRQSRMTSSRPASSRLGRGQIRKDGFVSTVHNVLDSDVDDDEERTFNTRGGKKLDYSQPYEDMDIDELDDDDEEEMASRRTGTRPGLRTKNKNVNAGAGRVLRKSTLQLSDDEDEESKDSDILRSDLTAAKKRRRPNRSSDSGNGRSKRPSGMRQSGRATRHQGGMREIEVDEIFRSDSEGPLVPVKPKFHSAKEVFKPLPRNDEFRMRHVQQCETCTQGPNFAPLVHCQGCTLSYHKSCLGPRGSREHCVTKVGDGDFVLQCRRCVAIPRKKDPTAPDQGLCQDCHQHGAACKPFRPRKTTAQEQKDREENDGEDPIFDVDPFRINNYENVMFRCNTCWRGFHFEHLPSRSEVMELDSEVDTEQRFREYSRDWKCKECFKMPGKVSGIIAWKPIDEDNHDPAFAVDNIEEDEKAYLVKWEGMSYFRATWMPGPWVWGVAAASTRKAFAKREDSQHPKMRTEDAIPEEYLRADIVLDIKFTSIVDICTEQVDRARIREIDKALIKYKGLGYEDLVWEAPPSPEDGDRWTDFVTAYNDWVMGRYIRQPKAALKTRLDKARKGDFTTLEKQAQPENLVGGELMKYQIEGLNWLYFKWFAQKNAVLADEMGLGKTIQIIGFLATLVKDWNCFPFLVVVPNSTCPNWRREIKRWAPSLRTVAFYGSKESRDSAKKYEMYPEDSEDLRCHIVVTSYDAAADDSCRGFFRKVPWQGLVVDEGQRLKNDKNLLYAALTAIKAPFKVLLTGTPLQNNTRELFNLLQFLDNSNNAAKLEEQFQDLDQAKINELHNMIRPYFLRRTKAQVLTFLPPMAQIILPVSMTLVQKKLYRSVLAKNPELMKAIFSAEGNLQKGEKGSLSNILMQLRKCLCHPFIYNKLIEERNISISASHRNLVDASSKLMLLETLLPKLQERGHRVLIFSQFLDMLDICEDFLDGMQMPYQRFDGQISALQKQKRIDEFNAPNSPLFAFLLSTRAGGVGINLATADTVIILDPDFNPHQDIQALSRAHRIGQQKKVLCFQLVTRASAEERIMQVGRKKLALDHVLIQEMDADDAEQNDLVSILRHGANEIFEDSGEQDIVYDSTSVDRLLDRSHIENTRAGDDKTAEVQFSNARVWANSTGALQDADSTAMFNDSAPAAEVNAPDAGVWAKILKERERVAAEEAATKAEAFGRGRRARGAVDYAGEKGQDGTEGLDAPPFKPDGKKKKLKDGSNSDTDFQAEDSGDDEDQGENEHDDASDMNPSALGPIDVASEHRGLLSTKHDVAGRRKKNGKITSSSTPVNDSKKTVPPPHTTTKNAAPSPSRKPKMKKDQNKVSFTPPAKKKAAVSTPAATKKKASVSMTSSKGSSGVGKSQQKVKKIPVSLKRVSRTTHSSIDAAVGARDGGAKAKTFASAPVKKSAPKAKPAKTRKKEKESEEGKQAGGEDDNGDAATSVSSTSAASAAPGSTVAPKVEQEGGEINGSGGDSGRTSNAEASATKNSIAVESNAPVAAVVGAEADKELIDAVETQRAVMDGAGDTSSSPHDTPMVTESSPPDDTNASSTPDPQDIPAPDAQPTRILTAQN